MKSLSSFTIVSLFAFAVGCSSVSVFHDYDREANFASLKTFSWMEGPRATARNAIMDKRIKNAVNSRLQAKAYQENSSQPDFLLAYHTNVKERLDVQDWGYVYGPRGRFWGRDVTVTKYKEGTLVLDIVDARSKQLIWRGVAQGALPNNPDPQKIDKVVNESVQKLLEKFPPA
jgi:hypothetical protein